MSRLLTLLASSGLALPYTDAFTSDGAFAAPWLNTAWAKTGGAGVAAVTLGAELVTNGGFDTDANWARAGMAIEGGVAVAAPGTGYVYISQGIMTNTGKWHSVTLDVICNPAGAGLLIGSSVSVSTPNTDGTHAIVARHAGNDTLYITNQSSGNGCTIDNVTVKLLSVPSSLQLLNAARVNLTASAKCTVTDGTQAGVALCWDSATAPANGVIGYYDRTNAHVKLDKCVAGTWTSVIDVAVTYSAGAVVKVVQTGGSTWRLYYGGVQKGTDVTISDAGIVSNTLHGLFSTYANSFPSPFTLEVS